jgi:hypothetical protein
MSVPSTVVVAADADAIRHQPMHSSTATVAIKFHAVIMSLSSVAFGHTP